LEGLASSDAGGDADLVELGVGGATVLAWSSTA
jgi:hypothetical protein